jgi:hypothetical protein
VLGWLLVGQVARFPHELQEQEVPKGTGLGPRASLSPPPQHAQEALAQQPQRRHSLQQQVKRKNQRVLASQAAVGEWWGERQTVGRNSRETGVAALRGECAR